MTTSLTEAERGKRRLGRQILLFQAALTVWGGFEPTVWEMAKFYAPFTVPSAIGLFLADGVLHNQRVGSVGMQRTYVPSDDGGDRGPTGGSG